MILKQEEKLQVSCIDFVRKTCPNVLCFMIPNGAYLGSGSARFAYIAKMKRMGLTNGIPDLCLIWNDNILFIELKAGNNKPSDSQKIVMDKIKSFGFPCETIYTFEEFVQILGDYGIIGGKMKLYNPKYEHTPEDAKKEKYSKARNIANAYWRAHGTEDSAKHFGIDIPFLFEARKHPDNSKCPQFVIDKILATKG